jgi:hypothetical protein
LYFPGFLSYPRLCGVGDLGNFDGLGL